MTQPWKDRKGDSYKILQSGCDWLADRVQGMLDEVRGEGVKVGKKQALETLPEVSTIRRGRASMETIFNIVVCVCLVLNELC